MGSPITIKLKCEPYLVKFLETLYGPSPISFPKNSNFNTMLDVFLDKPPLEFKQPEIGEKVLEIRIPYFENKNVLFNNYLSPTKQRILIKEISKFFKITYRGEISKYIVLGLDRQDAIQIFIEKYNLSQDNSDLLEKDFQRYVKLRSYHRLFRKKKNSSVKGPECPDVS
jgi:hypothetical protein